MPSYVVDRHLDPVEGEPVVDDTAAGLGHPIGRHDVGWERLGRRSPAEHDHAEAPRIDPAESSRDERHERAPAASGGRDVVGVECRKHLERCVRDDRARDDRQASDVGERQAREPTVVAWVDADALAGGLGGGAHGIVGEHDASRRSRRTARRHDKGVAILNRPAAGAASPAVLGRSDPRGRHRIEHPILRGSREAEVQRKDGVPRVPGAPELVDEARARHRKRHQLGHAREPTGLPC